MDNSLTFTRVRVSPPWTGIVRLLSPSSQLLSTHVLFCLSPSPTLASPSRSLSPPLTAHTRKKATASVEEDAAAACQHGLPHVVRDTANHMLHSLSFPLPPPLTQQLMLCDMLPVVPNGNSKPSGESQLIFFFFKRAKSSKSILFV